MATNNNLFEKVAELKEKFKHFRLHKKKLQALQNYSETADFKHKGYLSLIKRCMDDGFLGEEEAHFLSYMVDKYFSKQNFIDWTHKTRWLKSEIARLAQKYDKPIFVQGDLFEQNKLQIPRELNIPAEVLLQNAAQRATMRK